MIVELIRVRFFGMPLAYTYQTNKIKFLHGQKVVAQTEHGELIGIVNSFPYQKIINGELPASITRIANKQDLKEEKIYEKKMLEIKPIVSNEIKNLDLKMNLSHLVPVNQMKKIIVFYTAQKRVDFRQLIINLVNSTGLYIEMYWITKKEKDQAFAVKGACGHLTSLYNEGSLHFHRFSR